MFFWVYIRGNKRVYKKIYKKLLLCDVIPDEDRFSISFWMKNNQE